MQKIYIDITSLINSNFITGIQRVVRNVVVELKDITTKEIVFLNYIDFEHSYEIIDSKDFFDCLSKNELCKLKEKKVHNELDFSDFSNGDIFFDLDSVWNNTNARRSYLLPELKAVGVKIVVYIYDIIPITNPEYCHINTVNNFMNYLGAFLQYADRIIVSAQSTLDQIYELMEKLGLPKVPGYVSWLGSDFKKSLTDMDDSKVPSEVKMACENKYILVVGTIEPRKNHSFLMDAFSKKLYDEDLNLIFAGRIGWNVEQLKKRMDKEPMRGKKFFFFEGLNDDAIAYLYKNAFFVAFPTINEGFGLPIVESLQRGTPVLASRIPVLQEVGREYCDYFDNTNVDEFIAVVEKYLDENNYKEIKDRAKGFVPFTWRETAEKINDVLETLSYTTLKPQTAVTQMVFLTARVDSIQKTLVFVDKLMPFINEIIVCCPNKVKDEMLNCYKGRLSMVIITDEELLSGDELPEDHGKRNFFLRCRMMRHSAINNVFIMSDDDYRPLKQINKEVFVNEDSYNAYYCYDLRCWKGLMGWMTSYDNYIFRTKDFCLENNFPTLQYSSHMPQIIDKNLYIEMIDSFDGIENLGLDEWSSYFNYVNSRYPGLINSKKYVALAWPGHSTDWNNYVVPDEYLFENYYDFLYTENETFKGFSDDYNEEILRENDRKIDIYRKDVEHNFECQTCYGLYKEEYLRNYGYYPAFVINSKNDEVIIKMPSYLQLCEKSIVRIPVRISCEKNGLTFTYEIVSETGVVVSRGNIEGQQFKIVADELKLIDNEFMLPVFLNNIKANGKMTFRLIVNDGVNNWVETTPLSVVKKHYEMKRR